MTESKKSYPLVRVRKQFAAKLGLGNFPNFHASGSVSGMKKQYYGKDALLVSRSLRRSKVYCTIP